jgi:hypothetical protein
MGIIWIKLLKNNRLNEYNWLKMRIIMAFSSGEQHGELQTLL